jgi:hypothetical protein
MCPRGHFPRHRGEGGARASPPGLGPRAHGRAGRPQGAPGRRGGRRRVGGVLFFPPQIAEAVIKAAEDTVYIEDFKREMIRGTKYHARDIYPVLSPELEKVFEEWKKTHLRK